jgi:predicted transcriptional regulator
MREPIPSSTYGHKSIRPLLKRVGLDEKQSEIYLALLSLKTAAASDIAKLAKQSRSHTYIILRDLEKKGLVSEIQQNGMLQFIAEPPERLVSYLKDREMEYRELQSLVEGALPVLSSLTTSYVGSPRITVLKGLDGMKQVYRDILTQKFVGIYNAQSSIETFGDNIVTMLFGKDAKLHGRDLVVRNEGAKQYLKDIPPDSDYSVRVLPKGVSFDTDTIVYGDTVTLFAFDDERTIIRIENRKIADAFRAWFEMMWLVSKDAKSKRKRG